jgi:hypothetical protein
MNTCAMPCGRDRRKPCRRAVENQRGRARRITHHLYVHHAKPRPKPVPSALAQASLAAQRLASVAARGGRASAWRFRRA